MRSSTPGRFCSERQPKETSKAQVYRGELPRLLWYRSRDLDGVGVMLVAFSLIYYVRHIKFSNSLTNLCANLFCCLPPDWKKRNETKPHRRCCRKTRRGGCVEHSGGNGDKGKAIPPSPPHTSLYQDTYWSMYGFTARSRSRLGLMTTKRSTDESVYMSTYPIAPLNHPRFPLCHLRVVPAGRVDGLSHDVQVVFRKNRRRVVDALTRAVEGCARVGREAKVLSFREQPERSC